MLADGPVNIIIKAEYILLICIRIYTDILQSLSRVRLFVTPWTTACQASLSITNFWSLLRLMSIELVMPSNHLILCCSLLLLPSIFPGIRVFSDESALCIKWPKYWSFGFGTSPSNGEGNGKPLQYSCLENPMNSMNLIYLEMFKYDFENFVTLLGHTKGLLQKKWTQVKTPRIFDLCWPQVHLFSH